MFKRYRLCKLLVITNEFSKISTYYYSEKFKEWKLSVYYEFALGIFTFTNSMIPTTLKYQN